MNLGRSLGIPVTLQWTWFVFVVLQVIASTIFGSLYDGVEQLFFWLLVYTFVYVHEIGHIVAGYVAGEHPKSMVIHFLGAGVEFDPDIKCPHNEWFISLAGPLANLTLGVLFLLLWNGDTNSVVVYAAILNISLALMNLLPIYPLDGGRILYAFLRIYKSREPEQTTLRAGYACCGLFFVGGVFSWPLIIVAAFLLLVTMAGRSSLTKTKTP